jgi:hypothetical protein
MALVFRVYSIYIIVCCYLLEILMFYRYDYGFADNYF